MKIILKIHYLQYSYLFLNNFYLFCCFPNRLTDFFFNRHHAQVFRVKTAQSAFLITVQINIIVIALLVTMEDTAKQVRLGSFSI